MTVRTGRTTELIGRVAALETVVTCLVWHWASGEPDRTRAIAFLMDNAFQQTRKALDVGSAQERAAAAIALESLDRITQAMLGNLNEQAPDSTAH